MEIPQAGRAIINETFNNVEIIIPVKKNYLFLAGPLFGIIMWWVIGAEKIFKELFSSLNDGGGFQYIWIAWVGFILLVSLRAYWWMLAGKEIINVGDGVLSIKRKGDWIARTRSYDLNEVRYLRSEDNNEKQGSNFLDNFRNQNKIRGTVCFEYGADTIRFGEDLAEAEGNYIIQRLKSKKVIIDKNFSPNI